MTASVQVQVDSDDFNENRSTAEYKVFISILLFSIIY